MGKNLSYFLIFCIVIVSAIFVSTLDKTTFDYDFEKFFQANDPHTSFFYEHRDKFGTDNDFVLVSVVNNSGVFNPEFLQEVKSLSDSLETCSFVTDVISPVNLKVLLKDPLFGNAVQRPLLHLSNDSLLKKDSVFVFTDEQLMENFFARDIPALSLLIITRQELSKEKCDILANDVLRVMENFTFDEEHIAGRSIAQIYYINKIKSELSLFMSISILLILIFLFIAFRSFRGIIIPLATVLLAVIWSIGILNFSGGGIGLLLNMLPPVVFVVGMSDAVHFYSRYLEELRKGNPKLSALKTTIKETGLALLLTSITTAIGFASLYFTGIPALQDFGLYTAAGVIAAFLIAFTLMPAWLRLSSIPKRSLYNSSAAYWEPFLRKVFVLIVRYRKMILISGSVAIVFLAILAANIQLNNFILEDLRDGDPRKADFTYFDNHFGGVRPFELAVKLKEGQDNFIEPQKLLDLSRIQNYLSEEYGVQGLFSLVSIAETINRANEAGKNSELRVPEDEKKLKRISADLKRIKGTETMRKVINRELNYTRVSGRVPDLGGDAFADKNTRFFEFINKQGLDQKYEITVTGTGNLIDATNQNIVGSLVKGLGSAFLLIAVLMGIIFRSVKMVMIALIPNLIPLLMIAALMAVAGIDLKMSTGIIFTIAFGIAVDDTIHVLSRFKIELSKGLSVPYALKRSFLSTGRAIIITSLILLGGFISLCFSTFQSTFYIGLLVSLTLLFALIADILFLPPLLLSFFTKKKVLKEPFDQHT